MDQPPSPQQDLLGDIDYTIFVQQATTGRRLATWIIDCIILALPSIIGTLLVAGAVRRLPFSGWLSFVAFILIIYLYYFLTEAATGRTLGKKIVYTKVISTTGGKPAIAQIALRTLCRFIPFEPLSAFGGVPWHDRISDTRVIKIKRGYEDMVP